MPWPLDTGAPLTKAYDVTIWIYHISHKNKVNKMPMFKILREISKAPFEISRTILNR